MCSQPILRSPRRLASASARSSPCRRDAPQLRLGAAAVGGDVDAAGVDTDGQQRALEVALHRLADLLRFEPDLARARTPALLLPEAIEISRCSASTLEDPRPAATLVASSAA